MRRAGALTGVLMLGVLAGDAGAAGADDTPLSVAREHLRVTAAAEVRVREEYELRRAAGALDSKQHAEYEAYLERIGHLVAGYREEVARLTGELFETPVPAHIDISTERTHAEGIAGLDAELDASLGDFDAMLLREQEELAARTRTASGGGGGVGDAEHGDAGDSAASASAGAQGAGERGGEAPARRREVSGASATARSQVAGAGGSAPRGAAGGKVPLPDDVPDGSDDDIVARQLREAAEKETDPELREKLWAEYRKYKDATR